MSTKKLSRTVIEGGRYGFNKWERRYSHAEVRAEERNYLKEVMANVELADETEIEPCRPVRKEFTDKLSPMYRWLDAQVGRPWDQVRSEVFQKFDTRTTAGRHITFDHLLREVVDSESGFDKFGRIIDPTIPKETSGRTTYYSIADYYVDQHGILCRGNRSRRYFIRSEKVTEEEYNFAAEWLNNRMIMEADGKLHWLAPTQDIWLATWFDPYNNASGDPPYWYGTRSSGLAYYVWRSGEYKTTTHYSVCDNYRPYPMTSKTFGDHWERVKNPYSFRQRGELSNEEVKVFKSFKQRIRNDILLFGKGR